MTLTDWVILSQILQLTWKSVGGPNPSRGDNFFRRPLAPKILLVPPQVSYMVGISGKVAPGYTCQNLCNWILEGTRADLAPPLYCQFAESKHFLVYFSRNPSSDLSSDWFSISLQYLGGVNVQFNHVSLWILWYITKLLQVVPSRLHLGVGGCRATAP